MDIDWNHLHVTWYSWLSSLNAWLAGPVRAISDGLGVPLLSAFLLGVLGTTAPCQLSTNFGAFAFLARRPSARTATVRATLAYVAAKVAVYTVLGLVVLLAGRQVLNTVGPYIDWPRKAAGPLMVLLGLAVFGVIRVRLQAGQSVGKWLERRAAALSLAPRAVPRQVSAAYAIATESQPASSVNAATRAEQRRSGSTPAAANTRRMDRVSEVRAGSSRQTLQHQAGTGPAASPRLEEEAPSTWSSFLLGAGFSLAFCPTLFLLFFGATLGLAARSAEGFAFPALFALGTVVPLALLIGLTLAGSRSAERVRRGMRRAHKPLSWLAGAVLVLLGLHDTLVYWFV